MFNLKAANGQVILTSQTYKTKAAAKNGIKSVCTNCMKNDRLAESSVPHYFITPQYVVWHDSIENSYIPA